MSFIEHDIADQERFVLLQNLSKEIFLPEKCDLIVIKYVM